VLGLALLPPLDQGSLQVALGGCLQPCWAGPEVNRSTDIPMEAYGRDPPYFWRTTRLMNIEEGISNHEVDSRNASHSTSAILHSIFCGSLSNFCANSREVTRKASKAGEKTRLSFQYAPISCSKTGFDLSACHRSSSAAQSLRRRRGPSSGSG